MNHAQSDNLITQHPKPAKTRGWEGYKRSVRKNLLEQKRTQKISHMTYAIGCYIVALLIFVLPLINIIQHLFQHGLHEWALLAQQLPAWDFVTTLYLYALIPLGMGILFQFFDWILRPKKQEVPHSKLYVGVRIICFILSMSAMIYSLQNIAITTDHILSTASINYPLSDRELSDTVWAGMARAAAKRGDFNTEISNALRREDIEHAGIYVDISDRLNLPIAPHIRNAYNTANSNSASLWRTGKQCLSGFVMRESENMTQIACMIAGDLNFSYGDYADLIKEISTAAFSKSNEADYVVMSLAALGIGLNYFGKDTADLKKPAIVLKHGFKNLRHARHGSKLGTQLKHLVGGAFDIQGYMRSPFKIMTEGSTRIRRYVKPAGLKRLSHTLGYMGDMMRHGRLSTPLYAMKYARHTDDLALYGRLSKKLGKHSDATFDILKHNIHRLFRVFKVSADTAYRFYGAVSGTIISVLFMIMALFGQFIWAIAHRIGLRYLRHAA